MSQSPAGGSPQSGGANPGPPTAEAIFGQILQQMQAGMGQMAQDSNRRFERGGHPRASYGWKGFSGSPGQSLGGYDKEVQRGGRQRRWQA